MAEYPFSRRSVTNDTRTCVRWNRRGDCRRIHPRCNNRRGLHLAHDLKLGAAIRARLDVRFHRRSIELAQPAVKQVGQSVSYFGIHAIIH
jgi:hypothetical protein